MEAVIELLRSNARMCRDNAKCSLELVKEYKDRQNETYAAATKYLAEADACDAAANQLETQDKLKEGE